MKIVYAGTPEFAVAPLEALLNAGANIVCVITQADKPQGRKKILTPSPVKAYALSKGLPVFDPAKIKDETAFLRSLDADIMITCAYGQILTEGVLDAFKKGVWNIHAGILPKFRGASPIQSCILAGEKEAGVCIIRTELSLDTGDILLSERTPIGETETAGELAERLSAMGARLIVKSVELLEKGDFVLTPQGEDGACVYKKIDKEKAKVDFSRDAETVVNLVRAMNPEPYAYSEINGIKINIRKAEKTEIPQGKENAKNGEVLSDIPSRGFIVKCAFGAVKITELQPAGGKPMKGSDFLNGRKVKEGQIFVC